MRGFRLAYLSVGVVSLALLLPSIVEHALWMMGGESIPFILKNRWDMVAINAVFFILFLALIPYRSKVEWRSKGVYSAFILALFAEMYGFPLTAYFVASRFGVVNVDYRPAYAVSFRFLDVIFTLPTMMIVGGAVTVLGLVLIILGWRGIHKNKTSLVTTGVYRYSRHPQYAGILLVTSGWLIHWPTILTLLMWPVLVYSYVKLAKREEDVVGKKFPEEYEKYRKETPMFI